LDTESLRQYRCHPHGRPHCPALPLDAFTSTRPVYCGSVFQNIAWSFGDIRAKHYGNLLHLRVSISRIFHIRGRVLAGTGLHPARFTSTATQGDACWVDSQHSRLRLGMDVGTSRVDAPSPRCPRCDQMDTSEHRSCKTLEARRFAKLGQCWLSSHCLTSHLRCWLIYGRLLQTEPQLFGQPSHFIPQEVVMHNGLCSAYHILPPLCLYSLSSMFLCCCRLLQRSILVSFAGSDFTYCDHHISSLLCYVSQCQPIYLLRPLTPVSLSLNWSTVNLLAFHFIGKRSQG
jgi:hypothetical protein